MTVEIVTLMAEGSSAGPVWAPWWLRIGVLVYGVLLIAAFMIYAQTKHQRPWSVIWVLIIGFVPILGALAYFTAMTVKYRQSGRKPTKGRAETMAPEEYTDYNQDDGENPHRRRPGDSDPPGSSPR